MKNQYPYLESLKVYGILAFVAEAPKLYTQESIVYEAGVEKADTARAVFVMPDTAGNHALTDGNHRAFKAYLEGDLDRLPRRLIGGPIQRDISKDPKYKPVSKLRAI